MPEPPRKVKNMNRILSLAAVAVISSITFANVTLADSLDMNTAHALETTLRSYNATFDVRQVNNWDLSPEHLTRGGTASDRSIGAIEGIRSAIEQNKPLAGKLQQAGVKVSNIVDVEQAADGSITFYSR